MNVNHIEEVKEYIYQFEKYIKIFNTSLIKTYNLDCEPTYNEAGRVFPRNGTLISNDIEFNYRYHGCGCTLMIDEIMISYDIDVLNNNEIIIPCWYFNEFIKTYSKNQSSIHIDELDEIFFQLVEQGVLIQRKEFILVFNINDKYWLNSDGADN